MFTPFKLFAGEPAGSGKQWRRWIHIEDLVGILVLALDQPNATGPINGTAPHPVSNRDFATALGEVLHRASFFPTPAFTLRLALGEVANVVTTGQRRCFRGEHGAGLQVSVSGAGRGTDEPSGLNGPHHAAHPP